MQDLILEIIKSEQSIRVLGLITTFGIFISPFFYNGDYRKPIRAVVISITAFICAALLFNDNTIAGLSPTIKLAMVLIFLIAGLYMGVFIYNVTHGYCKCHWLRHFFSKL